MGLLNEFKYSVNTKDGKNRYIKSYLSDTSMNLTMCSFGGRLLKALTKHWTPSITKALAAGAETVQKISVGLAGVSSVLTHPFNGVHVEEHRPLVVTFEIGWSCVERVWIVSVVDFALKTWLFGTFSKAFNDTIRTYQRRWSLGSQAGLFRRWDRNLCGPAALWSPGLLTQAAHDKSHP